MQYPQNIVLTITDKCNQTCKFCAGVHRKAAQAEANPDALRLPWLKWASSIMIVGSGEALAHPQYPDIIKNVYESAPNVPITLYTNGLGLYGKNLEYTLRYARNIKISQNSLTESVYNTIISGGNYKQSIINLKELSKKMIRRQHVVTLMLVGLKQNIHEIKKFIGAASHLGFYGVHLMKGFYPGHAGLSKDSYIDTIYDILDIEEMEIFARENGVNFTTNLGFRQSLEKGVCLSPWNEARFIITNKGWHFNVCCRGSCNIYLSDSALQDIDNFWSHERITFIRRTVNSEEIIANKMCLKCRLRIRDEKNFYDNKDIINKKLNIKDFDPIYLT